MALDILIVDDERDIRELVAGVLSDEGYDCRTAGDSVSALEAIDQRRPSLVVRAFERGFEATLRGYTRTLDLALRWRKSMLALTLLTFALTAWLFVVIPKGFFPPQDTGRMMGFIRADQTTSFESMQDKMSQFVAMVRAVYARRAD